MRNDYNPFSKAFDDINPADLSALLSVAEGWYVEYKREVPNAGAVAKSITAFANTYGGWIFYGVTEKSKEDAVAGAFPGIATDEADVALQRIRQAVANHAQPSPYFRVKALFGPIEVLGLEVGRCVIVGHIPWGPAAPYVHRDGRIYRRVGDGSEPKPENDRFVLDQLWGRASKITDGYARWIDRELETSKAEENAAYLRIFLVSDFWRDHSTLKPISLRKVREIMSNVDGSYAVPFTNVHRSSEGFVCRQSTVDDPESLGLTWILSPRLDSEIVIPLAKYEGHDLGSWLNGYEFSKRFQQVCLTQRYHRPTVIDLNLLFQILLGLARTHLTLAEEFGWTGPVFAKMQISGVWRAVPFFDTSHVLEEYEKHGITLCLRGKITLHPGTEQSSFIELPSPEENDDGGHRVMIAIRLFAVIAITLGAPLGIDVDGDDSDVQNSFGAFLDAGTRAMQVQGNRSPLRPRR